MFRRSEDDDENNDSEERKSFRINEEMKEFEEIKHKNDYGTN